MSLVTLEQRGAGHGEKEMVLIWVLCLSYCCPGEREKGHKGHKGHDGSGLLVGPTA